MKPRLGFISSLTMAATAACSVYPEYQRPEIGAPEHWQAKTPVTGETANLDGWWRQFHDPVLSALLDAALSTHPRIDKALAAVQSARASLRSAEGAGLPSLSGSGSYKRSQGGVVGGAGGSSASLGAVSSGGSSQNSGFGGLFGGITQILSGSLDASWEIDLFGKLAFGKQAELARLQSEQYNSQAAQASLAAETAGDYASYRACELTEQAYRKLLASRQESQRLTAILAKAGFSAASDTLQAEANRLSSQSALAGQHAECEKTVKSLTALSNLAETQLRALLASGNGLPAPADFRVESVPAQLLRQRPDILAGERKLAAASADIGAATAKLYPRLSLTGSVGRRQGESSGISINSTTWSFGPSVTLPLFDGGQSLAKLDGYEAAYASALAEYRDTVLTAVKEVEQALVDIDSAEQRELAERQGVEQYRQSLAAAEADWRSGGISLLALEEAKAKLLNQEISHINQQHNRVQYWIALYKALGGGWRTADTDARQQD